MTELRESRPAMASRRGGFAAVGLAMLLAGCGNTAAPLVQPVDAGQPAATGPARTLAQNGVDEHGVPRTGPTLPSPGTPVPNGPAVPPPAQTPPTIQQAARDSDDASQPMAAEPLLDAGGFDPAPMGEPDPDAGSKSQGQAGLPHN